MEEVSRKINDEHWEANAVLSTKLEIFTYAQCYGFLSHKDCLSCYSETRTRLPKCLPSNSACIYLDGCFFRYDTYNFFKESLNEKHDSVKCSLSTNVSKDVYMGKEFQEKVFKVIENVTDLAVLNKGFALSGERGLEAVYAMAQCWMTDCLALLHVSLLFYCLVSLLSSRYFIDPSTMTAFPVSLVTEWYFKNLNVPH